MSLEARMRRLMEAGRLDLPVPGRGETPRRHRMLAAFGREDLSIARLAEAHTDAVAILAEAGKRAAPGVLYGVWASEIPDQPLRMECAAGRMTVEGTKMFCSGAGIVDRALVTVRVPDHRLLNVDLRAHDATVGFCDCGWIAQAFAETHTATAKFSGTPIGEHDIVGSPGWYLDRPGFWHGACGPAACWAGGAMGLVDWARQHCSDNPHARAHLGAMESAVWAMEACLDAAGREIDADPVNQEAAHRRALSLRHTIEQGCMEILQRFGRTFGPRPLAFDEAISRRYQELELYVRQSHAERDLEELGKLSLAHA